jgi:hypothetical protein
MAVLSLGLSILWLSGIGSLLAVILAVMARKRIKESRGSRTGEGFAIAGLVLGVLGVLGGVVLGVVLLVGVVTGVHIGEGSFATTKTVSMGTTISLNDSGSEISAVTVESVAAPVVPASDVPAPGNGREYAVAKVKACAGSSGSKSGIRDAAFSIGYREGQISSPELPVRAPDLGLSGGISANTCRNGYVGFLVANGTTPSYVSYVPDVRHLYTWKVAS